MSKKKGTFHSNGGFHIHIFLVSLSISFSLSVFFFLTDEFFILLPRGRSGKFHTFFFTPSLSRSVGVDVMEKYLCRSPTAWLGDAARVECTLLDT